MPGFYGQSPAKIPAQIPAGCEITPASLGMESKALQLHITVRYWAQIMALKPRYVPASIGPIGPWL